MRLVSVARGYDPRDFVLLAFGGSGSVVAHEVAKELGVPKIAIPKWPGVVSALGAMSSDVRIDHMLTHIEVLEDSSIARLEEKFQELEKRLVERLIKDGFSEDRILLYREVDARYFGQWRSLSLGVPRPLKNINEITDRFHKEYEREYNYSDPSQKVEVYALRVIGVVPVGRVSLPKIRKASKELPERRATRKVYYKGKWVEFDVYRRDELLAGQEIEGPAIIEQMDSTPVIPPGGRALVDEYGNLIMSF
jgi:N-methylhydantoinase A